MLALCRAHHAPTQHRHTLKRAKDKAFESKADKTDDDERGKHDVGVEKLLGVENDPAEAPIRCSYHLRAHNSDPGAEECLTHARDNERRRARNNHLPEQLMLVSAHCTGSAQPQWIDGTHT